MQPQSSPTPSSAYLAAKKKIAAMSQEELAFKTELHRTYISQLERDLKSPSLRTVSAIAAAFGLTLLQVVQRMSND